jgi:hypothetical protein
LKKRSKKLLRMQGVRPQAMRRAGGLALNGEGRQQRGMGGHPRAAIDPEGGARAEGQEHQGHPGVPHDRAQAFDAVVATPVRHDQRARVGHTRKAGGIPPRAAIQALRTGHRQGYERRKRNPPVIRGCAPWHLLHHGGWHRCLMIDRFRLGQIGDHHGRKPAPGRGAGKPVAFRVRLDRAGRPDLLID